MDTIVRFQSICIDNYSFTQKQKQNPKIIIVRDPPACRQSTATAWTLSLNAFWIVPIASDKLEGGPKNPTSSSCHTMSTCLITLQLTWTQLSSVSQRKEYVCTDLAKMKQLKKVACCQFLYASSLNSLFTIFNTGIFTKIEYELKKGPRSTCCQFDRSKDNKENFVSKAAETDWGLAPACYICS